MLSCVHALAHASQIVTTGQACGIDAAHAGIMSLSCTIYYTLGARRLPPTCTCYHFITGIEAVL